MIKIQLGWSRWFPTIRHDKNMPSEFYSTYSGGGSIMIWGAFSYGGTMELQVVQGRQSADDYIRMLQNASFVWGWMGFPTG